MGVQNDWFIRYALLRDYCDYDSYWFKGDSFYGSNSLSGL